MQDSPAEGDSHVGEENSHSSSYDKLYRRIDLGRMGILNQRARCNEGEGDDRNREGGCRNAEGGGCRNVEDKNIRPHLEVEHFVGCPILNAHR